MIFQELLAILALAVLGGAASYALSSRLPFPAVAQRGYDALFYLAAALTFLLFALLAVQRHNNLYSSAFDLASLDQVVWNTAQGRWFQSSLIPTSASLLGNHFSLILLAIAPLYLLWDDVRLLLILQSAALVLGTLPIYWLARERLGPALAFLMGVAALLFPPLLYLNQDDFHEIALAVPFLAFAAYFAWQRRYVPMLVYLTIAVLCREEIALLAISLGIYLFFAQGQRALGGLTALAGLIWIYLTTQVLIPYFQGASEFYYLDRYAYLGNNLGEMLLTLLTRPLYVLQNVLQAPKIEFLGRLLIPLALLPLLAPDVLFLALPTFGYLLLSNYPPQYDITSQYHAPVLPFLFFGTVFTLGRLQPQRLRRAAAGGLLVATLTSYYLHGIGPLSRGFDPQEYLPSNHASRLAEALALIPAEASVAAQNPLAPHISHRAQAYMFPWVPRGVQVDYILLDRQRNNYPFETDEAYEEAIARLKADARYRVLYDRDGFLLLRAVLPPKD